MINPAALVMQPGPIREWREQYARHCHPIDFEPIADALFHYSGEADLRPASRGADCAKSRLRDDDLVHINKKKHNFGSEACWCGGGAGIGANGALFAVMRRIGVPFDAWNGIALMSRVWLESSGNIDAELPMSGSFATAWAHLYQALEDALPGECCCFNRTLGMSKNVQMV